MRWLVSLSLTALTPFVVYSQDSARKSVPGKTRTRLIAVYDGAFEPIEGAQIEFIDSVTAFAPVFTPKDGTIRVASDLPTAYVRKLGYRDSIVTFSPADTVKEIVLEKVVVLAGMEAVAKRPVAEERARINGGTFIGTEVLRKPEYQYMNIHDVLAKNEIQMFMAQKSRGPQSIMNNQICTPRLIAAGITLDDSVNAITAVEFYPDAARTPAEFKGKGACGVLVLSTATQR